jgi:hypothetical protein
MPAVIFEADLDPEAAEILVRSERIRLGDAQRLIAGNTRGSNRGAH